MESISNRQEFNERLHLNNVIQSSLNKSIQIDDFVQRGIEAEKRKHEYIERERSYRRSQEIEEMRRVLEAQKREKQEKELRNQREREKEALTLMEKEAQYQRIRNGIREETSSIKNIYSSMLNSQKEQKESLKMEIQPKIGQNQRKQWQKGSIIDPKPQWYDDGFHSNVKERQGMWSNDNQLKLNRSFEAKNYFSGRDIQGDERGTGNSAEGNQRNMRLSYNQNNESLKGVFSGERGPLWASNPITDQTEKYSNPLVLKEYKKMLGSHPYNPIW